MSGHWAAQKENTSILGIRILIWIYQHGGRNLLRWPMILVVGVYFLCERRRRKASINYLRRLHSYFGGRSPFQQRPGWRESFSHFKAFGEAILDKIAVWLGDLTTTDLIRDELEYFETLYQQKRGALILTSHLGNVEICRAIGRMQVALPIVVLVHTEHAQKFNDLMNKINPAFAVEMIQVQSIHPGITANLLQLVEAGSYVVIVGDRTPVIEQSGNIVWTEFLGEPAPFSTGPYILAKLLACPVLLLFCLKQGKKYRVILEPFEEKLSYSKSTRDTVIKNTARRFTARLEHYLRQYPHQWFNFHDFWALPHLSAPEVAKSSKYYYREGDEPTANRL